MASKHQTHTVTTASQQIANPGIAWLIVASLALLLTNLGLRELWTQEGRWAMVCWNMLIRHDIWHPYLVDQAYYDKPLLSYWLILFVAKLTGFNAWALRLPSAIAGLVSIFSSYQIGKTTADRQTGLVAAWLLLTTFFFLFWARTASADILNLATILAALMVYFRYRDQATFLTYLGFVVLLVIGCLCKGLIAAVTVVIVLLPELLPKQRWRKHLRLASLLALIIGFGIYLLPFLISNHLAPQHYTETGLREVFRENILRYFSPFDHKGHVYTYVIYLPLYLLPWTICWLPATWHAIRHWRHINPGYRWATLSLGLLFIFFTLSGSRRSYYGLPMMPFALLMTAHYLTPRLTRARMARLFRGTLITFVLLLFSYFCVLTVLPNLNDNQQRFANAVKHVAVQQRPWQDWKILSIKALPRHLFYLRNRHLLRSLSTAEFVVHQQFIPNTRLISPGTLIVSRYQYLAPYFTTLKKHYHIIVQQPDWFAVHFNFPPNPNWGVALIRRVPITPPPRLPNQDTPARASANVPAVSPHHNPF